MLKTGECNCRSRNAIVASKNYEAHREEISRKLNRLGAKLKYRQMIFLKKLETSFQLKGKLDFVKKQLRKLKAPQIRPF